MIDITKPMHLFGDRSKVPEFITINKILFQTGDFILCHSDAHPEEPILINTKTACVINQGYWSWYATN